MGMSGRAEEEKRERKCEDGLVCLQNAAEQLHTSVEKGQTG